MITYAITFILAFCSIVYELLLGQTLSAFLGNTVLRYSVTIGLYMMSLGIGSMIAEGRFVERPVTSLLRVEPFHALLQLRQLTERARQRRVLLHITAGAGHTGDQ